jgi:DNA-binding LacI/PurR family transcriptional regulator
MIEVLNSLDTSRVGGVLFLPVLDTQRSVNRMLGATLRSLQRPDFFVVALDRFVPEYEGSYVMTDHKRGAVLMTDYLVSQGQGSLAVLYEHPENTSIDLRSEGLRESLAAGNRELARNRMIHLPYEAVAERGEAIIRGLLADRIGFFGVDIVLKNLESPIRGPGQMLLEPELVIRRSVAPA